MVMAERGLTPVSAISDRMPGGIAMSATLHVAIALLIVLGLPTLFRPAPLEDMPIAVELVNVAPETRATHPNPYTPRPEAKPDVTPAPPAPKPEPKPEPPKPAYEPPPSAAAPPPPAPTPQPPAPTPAPTPPAPPPVVKPAETPEPQPVPKPPPPKPVPPKPTEAPPKPQPEKAQTAAFDSLLKNLAKQPDKKTTTNSFDSLLKNLAKEDTAEQTDTPPQRPQRVAAAQSSSQPKAPLGSRLTTSELDMIKRQIAACWNVPAGARDAKDLIIELKVDMNSDGTVSQVRIVDTGRYASDDFFRAAADSAVRAVRNPRCSPLRLPPDKYEQWKNLDLFFNPKDVL